MPGNSIGHLFRLTTFGESHGSAIGGVLDGCPAGLKLDFDAVQLELDRRRPGSTSLGTAREEADQVEWLSGIHEGITLGTPIAFLIRNSDARSSDYDALKDLYRPGHADYTWEGKYGLRDHRGGGRSSARTTAACVVGGAIARQLIAREGIGVQAFVSRVGDVALEAMPADLSTTWVNDARCPDGAMAERMKALIEQVRAEGDSIGGIVSCIATGMPVGLGEPVFDKLDADLAKAMLSINAAKGFQIGSGFASARMRGSENNDELNLGWSDEHKWNLPDGARVQRPAVRARTNHAGGSLGGISNGEDLTFEVAFKPPATIGKAQRTVNRDLEEVVLEAKGRHDPCVVPRAVPIVEAMACMVLADHLLRQRNARA